jgi:hypothetical protein
MIRRAASWLLFLPILSACGETLRGTDAGTCPSGYVEVKGRDLCLQCETPDCSYVDGGEE